ncbi:hypothetical protein C2S52_017594 [Perilla frutescens var. hirtella]|nr:hypothetical protein C2S52_017594 [Perilla frutescens var. hirtella]
MGSSALFRRWSGAAGIFRSLKVSADGNFNYRMISTMNSFESPLLMLNPKSDGEGRFVYKFQCLAKNYVYSFFSNNYSNSPSGRRQWNSDELENEYGISDFRFVGSSHGWVALYNERIHDLFLSDPISDRHIKLPPPLHTVKRLILSSSADDEKGCLAFMTLGSGDRVAFCSPLLSDEWSLFGGDDKREGEVYDNLVYSRRHNRVFCITSAPTTTTTKLEVWDVGDESARLDWMMMTADLNHKNLRKLKYIVSAEQTGELYLVVRHVIIRGGVVEANFTDPICSKDPYFSNPHYGTVDIDVYKIDRDRGKVTLMENSLEGLAMFVGINHPFAIIPASASGLKPNSIYFTYDDRLRPPYGVGEEDNGIFDYQNRIFDYQTRDFSPFRNPYPIQCPIWFSPVNNFSNA